MQQSSSLRPLRVQVGVLLSGCGHYDGTDAQEAVLCSLALDRAGARVVGLAPQRPQLHVVDHSRGDEMEAPERNVLLEASRVFHERVHPVPGYALETLQGLVVPGGFGCAKNLMSGFARRGERRALHPEVEGVIRHFVSARKPVGMVGLGEIPVRALLGLPLEDAQPEPDPAAPWLDPERRLVATPGYKAFTRVTEVAEGIEAMVSELMKIVWAS